MQMYLIVIEAEGAGDAYHYQPYRLASTVDEAKELMRDYMRIGADEGALCPEFFALYKEVNGEFGSPEYFDPCSVDLNPTDATEWLARTGRC